MSIFAAPAASGSIAPPPQTSAGRPGFFRELLSELNPLQYIPVIGTLYRAVTGDTIPDTARMAGSLVVGFLTGGPIGVAVNLGAVAAEKATGIDPDAIGQKALASMGIGGRSSPQNQAPAQPQAVGEEVVLQHATVSSAGTGWSRVQLAAYGVTIGADGELARGALRGSDVLNDLELGMHGNRAAVLA